MNTNTNKQDIDEEQYTSLFQALKETVNKFPDYPAVCNGKVVWSYQKLWNQTGALVRFLKMHGITQGDRVAIFGNKNHETITAILANLLLGSVAVPIDIHLPDIRKVTMSNEATCKLILNTSNIPVPEKIPQEIIIAQWNEEQNAAETDLEMPEITGHVPAYIFFTSGTSGVPKGILGSHKSLLHYVLWHRKEFRFKPGDRIAQLASISFDACLKDLLPALISGASVWLPFERPLEQPDTLLKWLTINEISIVQTVPSVLSSWLHTGKTSQLRSLRLLNLSGEPLYGNYVETFTNTFKRFKGEITNLYGTTETTILNSFYRVPHKPSHAIQSIGQAIPGNELLLLNTGGGPCAFGEPGQVVIRTCYPTLGYINGVPEDNGRFSFNPDSNDPYEALFRTGDYAKQTTSGEIQLIGRKDDQVKIRGWRVNPADVTAVLLRHQEIESAHVLAHRKDKNNYTLIAYITTISGTENTKSVYAHLSQHLPSAFHPAAIIHLPFLPLNLNGKVDRTKLPVPKEPTRAVEPLLPSTMIEKELAIIWNAILKTEVHDISKNFFELGGHSLLIFKVINAIQKKFGTIVKLEDFFNFPTIAGLCHLIENNKNSKPYPQEAQRNAGENAKEFLASPNQHQLWYLNQLNPADISYNMFGTYLVESRIEPVTLLSVWKHFCRQHEIMQAGFNEKSGVPFMHIQSEKADAYQVEDLGEFDEEKLIVQRIRLFLNVPFDLKRSPLHRIGLLRLPDNKSVLVLVIHHIISDAWSWHLMLSQIILQLSRPAEKNLKQTKKPVLSYRDYAKHQYEQLETPEFKARLKVRCTNLMPVPKVIELSGMKFLEGHINTEGEVFAFESTQELTQKIREFSKKSKVTPFIFLLSVFKLWVHLLTGEQRILIGSDHTDRYDQKWENVIGFFVNTTVILTEIESDLTFMQLLERVKASYTEAFELPVIPYHRLVEEIKVMNKQPVDPSGLFDIMFRMVPQFKSLPLLEGKPLRQIPIRNRHAKFGLTVTIFPFENHFSIELEYRANQYSKIQMNFWKTQWLQLIQSVIDHPSAFLNTYKFRDVNMPSLEQQLRIPIQKAAYDSPINEFDNIVNRYPDRVAFKSFDKQVCYSQLGNDVTILAQRLAQSGHPYRTVVAVKGVKSYESLVAILAVMKVSFIVLPMEVELSEIRQEFMLKDSGAQIVLDTLPRTIDPDADYSISFTGETDITDRFTHLFEQSEMIGYPAYIFYTSGSTGQPRGVMGTHEGISHFIKWETAALNITEHDSIAWNIHLSFDAVLRDIFLPICNGSCLCQAQMELSDHPEDFTSWLDETSITVLHCVPSIFNKVFSVNTSAAYPSLKRLRWICMSGESFSGSLIMKFWKHFPRSSAQFMNFYGSSETTMIKTSYTFQGSQIPTFLPAGLPLPQTEVYVINDSNELCCIGEVGKVVVRTPYRTLGYLSHSGKSAFYRNPYNNDPYDWLYETGDMGRVHANGLLQILGRRDDEIKRFGVRIHLSEIKQITDSYEGVRQCQVLVNKSEEEEQLPEILCFIEPDQSAEITEKGLLSFLSNQLPLAMMPSYIKVIEHIPLLPNGKVDRKALLNMYTSSQIKEYLPPQDQVQTVMAEIWSELLHIKRVSINDNFFRIGGHSLLATLAVHRMRVRLNCEIPLRLLIMHPTISELSQALRNKDKIANQEAFSNIIQMNEKVTGPALICIHPVSGSIWCYKELAAVLSGKVTVYAIQSPAFTNESLTIPTIEAISASYLEAIQGLGISEGFQLMGWSIGGLIAYEIARQLQFRTFPLQRLIFMDTYAPGSKVYSQATANTDLNKQMFLKEVSLYNSKAYSLKPHSLDNYAENEETIANHFYVYLHYMEAASRYRPNPMKFRFPITLFLASRQNRPEGTAEDLGWSNVSDVLPICKIINGDHYFILDRVSANRIALDIASFQQSLK